MLFGLSNARSVFIRLMNQAFKSLLRKFSFVYFDNTLVFSKTQEEHFEHLKQVIIVLECEQLYRNLKKCSLFTLEVVFFEYIVSAKGIQID